MSLMDKIRAWMKPGESRQVATRTLVVDAGRLSEHRGPGDRLSPRDQIQVLQQLARYGKQETLDLHAVFEGRPLREVDSGASYNGVAVHFADSSAAADDLMLKLAKDLSRRSPAALVTGNKNLEAQAWSAGLPTLRIITLRKAISGGAPDPDRDNRSRPPRRPGRPPPRGPMASQTPTSADGAPAQSAGPPAQDEGAPAAPAAPPPEKKADNSAVQQLIDLVE